MSIWDKKAITINLVLDTKTAYIEYLDVHEQYGRGRTVFVDGDDKTSINNAMELIRHELGEYLDIED